MVQFEVEPIEKWVKPSKTTSGNFDFTDCDNLLARDYTQGNKIQLVRNITPSGASAQEVKVTDGTETLSINTDGSLNVSVSEMTLATANRASNGTTAIYTVPAGKKAYIWYAMADFNGVSVDVITANSFIIAYSTHTASGFTLETTFQPSKPFVLTAGQIVNLVVTGHTSGTHTATIGYVEVSA